jgi:uncharacterized membrane protein (DUF2068 family)
MRSTDNRIVFRPHLDRNEWISHIGSFSSIISLGIAIFMFLTDPGKSTVILFLVGLSIVAILIDWGFRRYSQEKFPNIEYNF